MKWWRVGYRLRDDGERFAGAPAVNDIMRLDLFVGIHMVTSMPFSMYPTRESLPIHRVEVPIWELKL